jgi:hypothetical protein
MVELEDIYEYIIKLIINLWSAKGSGGEKPPRGLGCALHTFGNALHTVYTCFQIQNRHARSIWIWICMRRCLIPSG